MRVNKRECLKLFRNGYYIILNLLKLYYFHLNTNGKNIVVRFYNAHPFVRKPKSYEIKKKDFAGYEIKTSFFGFRSEIIFSLKTKKGSGKYPPVSISALNKIERKKLLKTLDNL